MKTLPLTLATTALSLWFGAVTVQANESLDNDLSAMAQSALKIENQELTRRLKEANATITKLQSDKLPNSDCTAPPAVAERADQTDQIVTLQRQIEALEAKLAQQATDAAATATDSSAKLRQQLTEANSHQNRLSGELAQQQQQLTELAQHNSQLTQQLADIEQHKSQLTQQLADIEQHKSQLTQQLADIEQHKSQLTQQLTDIEQHNSQLTQQLADVEQHNSQLTQQLADVEQHNSQLTQQLADIEQHNSQLTQQLQQAQEQAEKQHRTAAQERNAAIAAHQQLQRLPRVLGGESSAEQLQANGAELLQPFHTLRQQLAGSGSGDTILQRDFEQIVQQIRQQQLLLALTLDARGTYITRDKDSLALIAQRHYGDGKLWQSIYQANQHLLENPNIIHQGLTLIIP
ncbi:hypothetical protein D5085_13430 [Ectothiorhodospiraceae bacterium BW-2]|nr:hypothetical protein D5085_13430 [Ectothiorhodospiraceae bacterium BW-2]